MTVLVALLFVASAALRGYVPGAERGARETPSDSPWSGAAVVGLLAVAVTVVVIAVVVRVLNRSPAAPKTAALSEWRHGDWGRPTLRTSLIAFGLVLAWLLSYVLLSHLGGGGPQTVSPDPGGAPSESARDAGGAGAELPPPADADGSLLGYLYVATVIVLVAVVVGTIVTSRRQRRPAPVAVVDRDGASDPDQESGSETLARAAEVALAQVGDLSREPRKAIIACYVAMEGELSLVPDSAPRDFDTASEVLARAVEFHALRPDSATQLVDLFDEARFSPHVMTEEHRDAAVDALTRVLDELRSHA